MSLNRVILYGNVARKEMKYTNSGLAIVEINIATNEYRKGSDGIKKQVSEFHRCKTFGKTAEIINQYFDVGRKILVEGKLQTDSYEKNGEKKYVTNIIIDNFSFGEKVADKGTSDSEKSSNSNQKDDWSGAQPKFNADFTADEIPF